MLSIPHLIIIFLVALVVLGPEKLPEVARVLGKVMAEFRKVTTDFRSTLENEMNEIDRQAREKERLAREAAAKASTQTGAPVAALPESDEGANDRGVATCAATQQERTPWLRNLPPRRRWKKLLGLPRRATGGNAVEPTSNGESHPA